MTKPTRLFLVEDEISIQDLLEAELTEAGFDVVVAGDGMQALAELEANGPRFGAIITDVNLGRGPDGWEVSRRARDRVFDIPVIYITGGNAHEWPSRGVPGSVLLTKPFTFGQLVAVVSTLLTMPSLPEHVGQRTSQLWPCLTTLWRRSPIIKFLTQPLHGLALTRNREPIFPDYFGEGSCEQTLLRQTTKLAMNSECERFARRGTKS